MFQTPKIGTSHARKFVVCAEHCIDFEGISVLSTPHLIWELEHAALDLLLSFLSPEEISLGISLDIEHRAPAIVGDQVDCSARVVLCDGFVVTFQVAAECRGVRLAQGLHKRRVVNKQKLLARLQARSSTTSA